MSKKHSRDLFDESTMTFGEHLEELRIRLWRAIVGLVLVTCVTMFYGDSVMAIVRKPIEDALKARGQGTHIADEISQMFSVEKLKNWWNGIEAPAVEAPAKSEDSTIDPRTITITIKPDDLLTALHEADPNRFPAPPAKPEATSSTAPANASMAANTNDAQSKPAAKEKTVSLKLSAPEFEQFQKAAEMANRPKVFTVQEAFMTWMKVSFVAGLVLSSPWVFYQLWQFVAAGLYPHEQKYIHIYLPFSCGLFLGGAAFCFYCVFPFVLDFLLGFSDALKVDPQIRLAEWINFAILLPVMFGISFQLPLVMLFLERLSVFEVKDFREKRRIAIFVITIISMILTPAEPYSMVMMMMPLILLYELGILICVWFPKTKPFDDEDEGTTKLATTPP